MSEKKSESSFIKDPDNDWNMGTSSVWDEDWIDAIPPRFSTDQSVSQKNNTKNLYLECKLCFEKLTYGSTVTLCGHVACENCTKDWLKEEKNFCHTCGLSFADLSKARIDKILTQNYVSIQY